jgi:hypothetical protein
MVVEAAFAIGRVGEKERLPEALRSREVPSDGLPLDQLVFEGFM